MAGVRAKYFAFRNLAEPTDISDMMRDIGRVMRQAGAQRVRVTLVGRDLRTLAHDEVPVALWGEGWDEVPAELPPFDPPLFAAWPGFY